MENKDSGDKGNRVISKILIGEPKAGMAGNVAHPFRLCTVITENGAMWDIVFKAFGATKENVAVAWECAREQFQKRQFSCHEARKSIVT